MPWIPGLVADPFSQLNEMAWSSSEGTPDVAAEPASYTSNISSLENSQYLPQDMHIGSMQSEQVFAPQQTGGTDSIASAPSWYTGMTNTLRTEEHEKASPLVDVTLDITQLMYNLLLSVSCLGTSQGYRKTDIDQALRASVMFHT